MAKYVYYFRHDANASQDLKLKTLRKRFGWAGNGWFWYVVECLRTEEAGKLEYSDAIFEGLSIEMGCESKDAKSFIDTCLSLNLFKMNGTGFYSERLLRDMNHLEEVRAKRSEAGRASGQKRSGKAIPKVCQKCGYKEITNLEVCPECSGELVKDYHGGKYGHVVQS